MSGRKTQEAREGKHRKVFAAVAEKAQNGKTRPTAKEKDGWIHGRMDARTHARVCERVRVRVVLSLASAVYVFLTRDV